MSNFFNAIGVADMEKVHSAVIGWMLSDKCEGLNIDTRSKLLQKIFGIEDDSVIGLSGLRKRKEYVQITIPAGYKNTYIPDTRNNIVLM